MSLKVFKPNDKHFQTTLHAVRNVEYGEGSRLINPYIKTWCEKSLPLRDKDTLTEFIKKEHKSDICHDCKESISVHYRRKERAYHQKKRGKKSG